MTVTGLSEFARSWVSGVGGVSAVSKLMRDRDFVPVPVDGPELSPAVSVIAISADRYGIWLLDSGGTTHNIEWRSQ